MVCYSEKDFDAKGKPWRVGKYGNKIYHPTRSEIKAVFSEFFSLEAYKEAKLGKRLHHEGHCFLWKSKKL